MVRIIFSFILMLMGQRMATKSTAIENERECAPVERDGLWVHRSDGSCRFINEDSLIDMTVKRRYEEIFV